MADARALLRAAASDHHGPPKVNFWEDPKSPANWKAEQVRAPAPLGLRAQRKKKP
jgi:hypothetical protein